MSTKKSIPFFRPSISEEEIAEVSDSLRSGWLTTGPKTKQFEQDIASIVGTKYAVALNSCTAALHLALEATGIQQGDLVIVPTMTFAATAEIVRYFDAIPVFVDCDDTLNIDTGALKSTIEAILNNQPVAGLKPPYGTIRAIIPVHYGGYAVDMDNVMKIASEFDLDVIEDCAHTMPAFYRGNQTKDFKHTGTFGKVGCFSFYANKCITTGEGGMALTDDRVLAERMRLMSLHGMNNNAWKRFTKQGSWFYEIVAPGYKYNMTDVAASIGIHQAKRGEEFRAKRQRVAKLYTDNICEIPALQPPVSDPKTRIHSWHLYSLRLNLDRLTIDRIEFIERLKERGISCSVHWMPLHMQPYYHQTFGYEPEMFPFAARQWLRLISLPIFPSMTDGEIDFVIEVVTDVATQFSK
jgi:dTDP-4-amino-4,6-dideoxygalactose transaminase